MKLAEEVLRLFESSLKVKYLMGMDSEEHEPDDLAGAVKALKKDAKEEMKSQNFSKLKFTHTGDVEEFGDDDYHWHSIEVSGPEECVKDFMNHFTTEE